jgi:hypothetical protein
MKCLGLHNKPKAEVHPGKKLTGPKEEEEEDEEEEEGGGEGGGGEEEGEEPTLCNAPEERGPHKRFSQPAHRPTLKTGQ